MTTSTELPLYGVAEFDIQQDEIIDQKPLHIKRPLRKLSFTAFWKSLSGWRFSIVCGVIVDTVILLFITVFTLVTTFIFPRTGSRATLLDGSCHRTKSLGIWSHLLINVLSTTLLATSSYTMQCLLSPTRSEIDVIHRKGSYVKIGVPCLSNLFHVPRFRTLLYGFAALSSLPIHLLANSAIFDTLGTDSYLLTVAYQNFVDAANVAPNDESVIYSFNSDRHLPFANHAQGGSETEDIVLEKGATQLLKGLIPNMTRLENIDCIREYAQPLVAGRRHVIAVTSNTPSIHLNDTKSTFTQDMYYQSVDICPDCQTFLNWTDPTIWTCAFLNEDLQGWTRGCDSSAAASQAESFEVNGFPIEYCLSERVEQKCQLHADVVILAVVIACTTLKVAVLLLSLHTIPEEIIPTIGDAVASFLEHPDETTAGCCLLNYHDVRRRQQSGYPPHVNRYSNKVQYKKLQTMTPFPDYPSRRWIPGTTFAKRWSTFYLKSVWFQAISFRHFCRLVLFFLTILIIAIELLRHGQARIRANNGFDGSEFQYDGQMVGDPPSSVAALWRLGFGKVNVNFLITLPDMSSPSPSMTIQHVLLVNAPQFILSIFYFIYNRAWTDMLIAREWASYGRTKKGLRVSQPEGIHQRSSYFLTIPYAVAIPLQIFSALLHWFLSQSIFLARINVYSGEPFVRFPVSVINTVGYSLVALLCMIVLWVVLFVSVLTVGILFRLNSPIPVAGGCSMVISAACHVPGPERERGNVALCKVMWGVVPHDTTGAIGLSDGVEETDIEVRHCSFSAGDVCSPETLPLRDSGLRGIRETIAIFE